MFIFEVELEFVFLVCNDGVELGLFEVVYCSDGGKCLVFIINFFNIYSCVLMSVLISFDVDI